jgi:hypothetical protein
MKWDDEARQAVITALAERLPDQKIPRCVICGTWEWKLMDLIVAAPGSTDFVGRRLPEKSYASEDLILPLAVLTCSNCGNTHFLNVLMLGLAKVFLEEQQQEPESPSLMPSRKENAS